MPTWTQIYDPFGHWWLSALVAALPIVVLFTMMAGFRVKPHWAALSGAATAVLVACVAFTCRLRLPQAAFCTVSRRTAEHCLDCGGGSLSL